MPLPNVSNNHQEYNARVLEKLNAAIIILNNDLNSNIIESTINSMLKSKVVLKDMGQNAREIAVQNVEDKIYKEIKKILHEYYTKFKSL